MYNPLRHDIHIRKGLSFGPIEVQVKFSDESVYDLTDKSVAAFVSDVTGTTALLDLSPVVEDASEGLVSIFLDSSETSSLAPGFYLWDLVVEDSAGDQGPIISGRCEVSIPISVFT